MKIGGNNKMAIETVGAGLVAIGAALAVGITAYASGVAEGQIGAAAVGAIAEDEKLFGKGLILTVIPETLVIFGLVIAILLIGKI
jgi:V/A-type H+/Na+-transporting ATPase subunit K